MPSANQKSRVSVISDMAAGLAPGAAPDKAPAPCYDAGPGDRAHWEGRTQ